MHDLRIALLQTDQKWEDKHANLKRFEEQISLISEPVDIIVLPEMFHTSFSMNAKELAETMDNSLGLDFLRRNASEKNCAIYTSLIIKEGKYYRNRGVFVEPDGKVHSYDKRKSFGLAGEDKVFTNGTKETIVSFRGWNIQLQICYDLRFPEIIRNSINDAGDVAYDLVLYVANWPAKRVLHWTTLLKARAIENQSYVVGVNRIGTDGKGLEYSGDSIVSDPLGITISAVAGKEHCLITTLSIEILHETRKSLPFLKDR
jgi:predicted amidohydrolase